MNSRFLPPIEFEGELEYTVKSILDSQLFHRRAEFLVDWEGYSPADQTWEPLENVEDTAPFDEFITAYPHKANPQPVPRSRVSRRSSP